MFFLLQNDYKEYDMDKEILKNELIKQHYIHNFKEVSFGDYKDNLYTYEEESIPVGTLDFVNEWLNKRFNIKSMNPIEVPDILRSDKYLKRKYSIIKREDLPKSGYYFVKYVSKLKEFSFTGLIETLSNEEEKGNSFLKEGLYQVSEVVDILSEYRVFVHQDEIVNIVWYDGKPTIQLDMSLLLEMVGKFSISKDRPLSYTIDIAVIKDRGTAVLEVHPWVSVGLYSYMFGSYLPYAYRDGLDYYKNVNKQISEFSNFLNYSRSKFTR